MEIWQPTNADLNPFGIQDWELDYSALDKVLAGIKLPYKIIVNDFLPGAFGLYIPKRESHVVYVMGSLKQESASRTLWHEITHLKQSERYGPENLLELHNKQAAELGLPPMTSGNTPLSDHELELFQSIPLEREAYEASTIMHDELPLTREAQK